MLETKTKFDQIISTSHLEYVLPSLMEVEIARPNDEDNFSAYVKIWSKICPTSKF